MKNKNKLIMTGTPGMTLDATKIQRHCTLCQDEVLENSKGTSATQKDFQVK